MKVCPQCRAHYPTHFSVCPQDGNQLDAVTEFSAGTIIREKYEILEKLGQGGMGTVYKARHLVFNEIRALKIVSENLARDEQFLERFRAEAVIMRRLNHPNAVRVDDIDKTEDDRPFIVMEYIEGQSLREVLAERGALPVAEALEITRQACAGLSAAHGMGILHRDIKPDNIMVAASPEGATLIKIMDFGIAKIKESTTGFGEGAGATRTGFLMGTPDYMSPEQAQGTPGSRLTAATDIYSLGVVLYELLTGSQPFKGETPMAVLVHHMQTAPTPPHQFAPQHNIPATVSALVMRALEKEPARRFASASELESELVRLAKKGFDQDPASTVLFAAAPTVVMTPPPPIGETSEPTIPVSTPAPAPGSASTPAPVATPPPQPAPKRPSIPTPPQIRTPRRAESPRSKWPVVLGAALLLSVGGFAGWQYFGPDPVPPSKPVQPSVEKEPAATPPSTPAKTQDTNQTPPVKQPTTSDKPVKKVPATSPSQTNTQRQAEFNRHLSTGRRALQDGMYNQAISSFQNALAINPNHRAAKDGLRRAQLAKQAESALLGGSRSTASPDKLLKQGASQMQAGKYAAAIKTYEQALKIAPNNAQAKAGLSKARKAKAAEDKLLGARRN